MIDLLKNLSEKEVYLAVEGNDLIVNFKGDYLSKEIVDQIRENKKDIIEFLNKNNIELFDEKIPRFDRKESYPLTSSQKRLWFLSQTEDGNLAYNISNVFRIKGELYIPKLQMAFSTVLERHDSLRTFFKRDKTGEIRQFISEIKDIHFSIDYVGVEKGDILSISKHEAKSEIQKQFDLTKAPLVRSKIVQLSQDECILIITMHHTIGDGYSLDILTSEVIQIYNGLVNHSNVTLPELRIQYTDYVQWLQSDKIREKLSKQEKFWLKQFEGELPVLHLPAPKKRPKFQTYKGEVISHKFSLHFLEKIKSCARQYRVTSFMVLMSGLNALLHRYSGQNDIIIGTPIAGRNHSDLEIQVGLYINTLAIRTIFKESFTFSDLLKYQKEILLEAYENPDYPLDELVKKLNIKRDASQSVLFNVMAVLQTQQDIANKISEGLQGLEISPFDESIKETSPFDLTFSFSLIENVLQLHLSYNTDIYDTFWVERLIAHFENLLLKLMETPKNLVDEIDYLTEEEKYEILHVFNKHDVNYPKDKTIIDVFEAQVKKTPNAIALSYEKLELTYDELNIRANQLAHYLRSNYNILPNNLIGIKLKRSERIVVAILGILKSGGAYVPIDPDYPMDRISFIEEDSKSRVIIDEEIFNFFDECKEEYSKSNPKKNNSSLDLAYVIYTSGTTGRPKGTLLEHINVIRLFFNEKQLFSFNQKDVWTLFHSYSFDFSVWEIFGALLHGGKLIVVSNEVIKDTRAFVELVYKKGVTVLNQTPSAFYNVINYEKTQSKRNFKLRYIIFGGEALNASYLSSWHTKYPDIKLINMYGTTETTVHVTYKEIGKEEINSECSNIGQPIPTLNCYILDDYKHLAPVGIYGKIYVAGAGLARSYLNRPDITAQKFIENPFALGQRMYDTGDIGKWLSNGDIEFLGRKDSQVKIRGHRIELAEIEYALSQIKGIRQNCVVVKERTTETGSSNYLVGYYSANKNSIEARAGYVRDLYKDFVKQNNLNFEALNKDLSAFTFRKSELSFLYKEIFETNTYSTNITVNDGDIIFDVGANIGIASIFFAHQAKDLTIYSIEPIDKLYDVLNMNLFVHSHEATFKSFNCGLGEYNKDNVSFSFFRNNTVISSQYADLKEDRQLLATYIGNVSESDNNDQLLDFIIDSQEETFCQIKTISSIIKEAGIEKIDLLKIDVEKAELDVINGIEEGDWGKIKQMIVEVHDKGGRLEEIKLRLTEKGFIVKVEQETDLQNSELYIVYAIKNSLPISSKSKREVVDRMHNSVAKIIEQYEADNIKPDSISDILLDQLRITLPEYMIPNYLTALDDFPLTSNGKIDRELLKKTAKNDFLDEEYVSPKTATEISLAAIWEKILGVEKVGVKDDFFRLGGHSLIAMQVIFTINKNLSQKISIKDLFMNPTIESLSKVIDNNEQQTNSHVEELIFNDTTIHEVLYNQEWRYKEYELGIYTAKNTVIKKELHDVNYNALFKAVNTLVLRHENLRTLFFRKEDTVYQKIYDINFFEPQISIIDVSKHTSKTEELEGMINDMTHHLFDFKAEQSFKSRLIKFANDKYLFIFVIDHILCDATAVKIIAEELYLLYDAYKSNQPNPLPSISAQFKDYAHYHNSHYKDNLRTYHKTHFRKLFFPLPSKLKINSKFASKEVFPSNHITVDTTKDLPKALLLEFKNTSIDEIANGGSYKFAISELVLNDIKEVVSKLKISVFNFILASYSVFLSKISEQNEFVILSPISTRDKEEYARIVGWLIGNLVVRIQVDNEASFINLLEQCKVKTMRAMDHIYYQRYTKDLNTSWDRLMSAMINVIVNSNQEKDIINFKPLHNNLEHHIHFNISFTVEILKNGMLVNCKYKKDVIHPDTVENICNQFTEILRLAIDSPTTFIKDVLA